MCPLMILTTENKIEIKLIPPNFALRRCTTNPTPRTVLKECLRSAPYEITQGVKEGGWGAPVYITVSQGGMEVELNSTGCWSPNSFSVLWKSYNF